VTGDFKQANHPPAAALNGDTSKRVLQLTAKPGDTVKLSAAGSSDPDGHATTATWFVYREAGSFEGETKLAVTQGERTELVAPAVKKSETLHVILKVTDNGAPALASYRRAIITVNP
jgi:hypothetical protein